MQKEKIIFLIKKYSNYIKIAMSLTLLAIIFYRIDLKAVASIVPQIGILTMLLLFIICLIKLLLQTLCWQKFLQIKDSSDICFWEVVKTNLIGISLRFFTPGGFGVFGKVFYLNPDKKKNTFISIVIEKFFQMWIIWLFAIWACVYLFHSYRITALCFALMISVAPFFLPLISKKNFDSSVKQRYYKLLPQIFASQCIFEILTFVLYAIIIYACIGTEISFFQISAIIALILVANTIPITYSGLGLRETVSALLLPTIGVPVDIAVGASLIIFTLATIIPAIPGAIFIATHRR